MRSHDSGVRPMMAPVFLSYRNHDTASQPQDSTCRGRKLYPLGAVPSSLWRDMAGRLCHGSCTTRIPGPSWGAPHYHGFSLPSSTSSIMPALLGFGLSCSSSSFNSSKTTDLSGTMPQALLLGRALR